MTTSLSTDADRRPSRGASSAAGTASAWFLGLLYAVHASAQLPPIAVTLETPERATVTEGDHGTRIELHRDSTPADLHHMVVHLEVGGTATRDGDYRLGATDVSGRGYVLADPPRVLMVPARESYHLWVVPLSDGGLERNETVTIAISHVDVVGTAASATWNGDPVTITIQDKIGGGGRADGDGDGDVGDGDVGDGGEGDVGDGGEGDGGEGGDGNGDDGGGNDDGGEGGGGGGAGGDDDGGDDGDDDGDDDLEDLMAPYWHGTGGFAFRPTDGRSAVVRIACGGRLYSNREFAGADGLIVRNVSLSACVGADGRPLQGEMTFQGAEQGGWYWVDGDRNIALAPLVRESALNARLRPPVPGGVRARPAGDDAFVRSISGSLYGTLFVHDRTGFMGIVPHLTDLEGAGEHMAPYWAGGGGIVGRPLNGESATVRLVCPRTDGEVAHAYTFEAAEDGIVVELLPDGCYDANDEPVRGRLEADGLEDGVWYWINGGRRYKGPPPVEAGPGAMAAAAALVRRDADAQGLTVPVIPGGTSAYEGDRGTLFVQGRLMGVVPKIDH